MSRHSTRTSAPILLCALPLVLGAGCTPSTRQSGKATPSPASTMATGRAMGVLSLAGEPVDPLERVKCKAVVFVFTAMDCPISNKYAPTLRNLYHRYEPKGVEFRLVYADSAAPVAAIRRHMSEFGYPMPALRDPKLALAKRANVTVTPEAAVYSPVQGWVYHGRIDNRFVTFGQARPAPTVHDLRDVLDDLLAGRSVRKPFARAVGCYIPGI